LKVVLAFDSFKGSLSAREACEAAAEGLRAVYPDAELIFHPMADGGEGTAEALMASLGGEWVPCTVTSPLPERKIEAGFAWLPAEKTAVVEMAQASGLPLLEDEERNPLLTTTFGTGELIAKAIEKGAEKILLTVGGSATVDGGIGAAAALGWRFFDAEENTVPLTGGGLAAIERIEPPANREFPEVDVLCDVTNPLCGPNGAAHVYGPQKGAMPGMVEQLDAGLEKLAAKISEQLSVEVAELPGAGAAGGLSAGAVAFFGGKLVPGIDTVMEVSGLAHDLEGADWVLTGEGRLDHQSLQGKVVDGIARLAGKHGARTGVIAGSVQLDEPDARLAGLDFTAGLEAESLEDSMRRGRELLRAAARRFAEAL